METLAELRKETDALYCLSCGKCSAVCPLAGNGFSARRIAEELDDAANSTDSGALRCLTCAACEAVCPQDVRFIEFVRGLRTFLQPEFRAPCPHGAVFQSVARSMASGTPRRNLEHVTQGLHVADEGEIGLFVGCVPFFEAYFGKSLGTKTTEIARAAIRLLNHLGIEPVLVAEERCCGHDLYWSGDHASFRALAKANAEAFRARGVKHLLTTCAECCRTWRLDIPDAAGGHAPRVEHFAEFLASRIQQGELSLESDDGTRIAYHDPCRLVRHLDVAEAPRQMLESIAGGDFIDINRGGRDAVCCGTSGWMHCDGDSKRIQTERLRQAEECGADMLVTACPKCLIHLTCAQTEERIRGTGKARIEIRDLTWLAASLLEDEAEGAARFEPLSSGRTEKIS